jgi:cyclomaltodextrinase / maltogenic alpha-amylase / neopullulanase
MNRILTLLLAILAISAQLLAQTVWYEPAAPRVGDVVTIYYDARPAGGLDPTTPNVWLHWGLFNTGAWTTPPQAIWPAGSHLHTDNIAVQSPMTEQGDSVWRVTIDFDTATHVIAHVFTNGTGTWDNNSGQDWHLDFIQSGTVSWWNPTDPEPGDAITIYYDCGPGTLPDGATSVILHWGIDEQGHGNWQAPPVEMRPAGTVMQGVAARTPMNSLGNGLFSITINSVSTVHSIHYVATDGTNWDNNNNLNWDIFLTAPPVITYTHVIFRYDTRSAWATYTGTVNSLSLAGAFNSWSTTANPLASMDAYGNHWGEVRMPVGTNEYKFVINGSNWQIDPDNAHNVGSYNNSVIVTTIDSLPQIYDIQPGQNLTYYQGATVNVTLHVRGGDYGNGLSGAPVVYVNGQQHTAAWNPTNALLTLNPLPSTGLAYDTVRIVATDSAGRTGVRYLGYGFKQVGYAAADVTHDQQYADASNNFDLIRFSGVEADNGGALTLSIRYAGADPEETLTLVTISGSHDTYSEVAGFGGEVAVPGLAAGGISLLLLDPSSPYYDPEIHNRIHPLGDLSAHGPAIPLSYDAGSHAYLLTLMTADLEANLGSYQNDWYFTCSSFKAAGAAEGYCHEISEAEGGVAAADEPDAYDVIFMQAADVQPKMLTNYGLTRRTTFDAPGRGLAAISPDSLGPHMRHSGPVCTILTRGAPTTNATQTVKGRITSAAPLTSVWLKQNATTHPLTMVADSFTYTATLSEGDNVFSAYAVDNNGDTTNSPSMTFTLNVNHAPNVAITTSVGDVTCTMNASATTDPDGQDVSFDWTADANNPAPVSLNGATTAQASFTLPTVSGEYYFDLVASDPDQNLSHGRTFFTINGQNAHGFSNNEAADWVVNARIYEIFVRSFSPEGNLDGVTANLERVAALGCNCIWLMPIFEGPSDHGYEITDYYSIEQDYGTPQDLHELVAAAHALGIKVVLDMVINHTSISHPFMVDAQRYGRYSHYWDWYDRDAAGNPTHYYDWTSLPNINLNNNECAQYWIDMCKYWVTDFDIDGYRCDVAWGPMQRSPQFWVNWRQQLKEVKPELLLLAEAGATDFQIFDNRFDLAFDWNLHHEGTSSFNNMFPQIPGFTGLTNLITNFGVPWPAYKAPLRFMENHDETRFASVNTGPQTALAGSFCLSIPGAVMLYAGQEIGTTSQRGQIPWGSDPLGLFPTYYRVMNARKSLPALKQGDFNLVSNSAWGNVYSFSRYVAGADPVIWAGNFSPSSQVATFTIDLNSLGLSPDSTYWVSEIVNAAATQMTGAQLAAMVSSLSAYQSRIWVVSDSAIYFDADEPHVPLPGLITLGDAYPNPFNPSATLPLSLNAPTYVTIKVYDLLGREVDTLVDGPLDAGEHQLTWNAARMSSGLYFAVMQTPGTRQVRKLMLLR